EGRVVEIGARAHVTNTVWVLLHRKPELLFLRNGPGTSFSGGSRRAVERTDLQSHADGFEPRQPVPVEQSLAAAMENKVRRRPSPLDVLEQDVVMPIDDHSRAVARRLPSGAGGGGAGAPDRTSSRSDPPPV